MKILEILNVNFDYIIFGLGLAILYMTWSVGIKPWRTSRDIIRLFEEVLPTFKYTYSKVKQEKYNYILESNGTTKYKRIYIRVIGVPKVNTITVNSKNTWNLQYGGSNTPGKGFPYQKYLDELIPFLNMQVGDAELKLILVYKNSLKIQKYINESELEIVGVGDLVYDYKIITFEDFAAHFKDL